MCPQTMSREILSSEKHEPVRISCQKKWSAELLHTRQQHMQYTTPSDAWYSTVVVVSRGGVLRAVCFWEYV